MFPVSQNQNRPGCDQNQTTLRAEEGTQNIKTPQNELIWAMSLRVSHAQREGEFVPPENELVSVKTDSLSHHLVHQPR